MIDYILNDEAIDYYLDGVAESAAPDNVRLLEDGFYRLLEDGGYRLLEVGAEGIFFGSTTILWGDTTITFND